MAARFQLPRLDTAPDDRRMVSVDLFPCRLVGQDESAMVMESVLPLRVLVSGLVRARQEQVAAPLPPGWAASVQAGKW